MPFCHFSPPPFPPPFSLASSFPSAQAWIVVAIACHVFIVCQDPNGYSIQYVNNSGELTELEDEQLVSNVQAYSNFLKVLAACVYFLFLGLLSHAFHSHGCRRRCSLACPPACNHTLSHTHSLTHSRTHAHTHSKRAHLWYRMRERRVAECAPSQPMITSASTVISVRWWLHTRGTAGTHG